MDTHGRPLQSLGQLTTFLDVRSQLWVRHQVRTPHAAIKEVLAQRADQLTGRVVADITNPVNFEAFDSLTVPADSSAAAEIAAALPDSKVLKAFNTTLGPILPAGVIGGRPTTVLIAGDDSDAKTQLAGIITAGGLQAVDAGTLRRARELEALGFLQTTLTAIEKVGWTGGFAVVS